MPLRALGKRLLRVSATWVRNRADRILIRLGAQREFADDIDETSGGDSTADSPPEHWRRLVDLPPPQHWLDRVEAARGRFKTFQFGALAQKSTGRPSPPVETAKDSTAGREGDRHFTAPSSEPPRREPSLTFDGAAPRPLPPEEQPISAAGHRTVAPPDLQLPEEPSRTTRPLRQDGFEHAPARRPVSWLRFGGIHVKWRATPASRSTSQPNVEPRAHASPPRQPAPTPDAFASPVTRRTRDVLPELTHSGAIGDQRAGHRLPEPTAARSDRSTTSRGAEALVWPELPIGHRGTTRAAEIASVKSVRQESRQTDEVPPSTSARVRSPYYRLEVPRPPGRPVFDSEITRLPPARHTSEASSSYTEEPAQPWPVLPDTPPPAEREDWLAIKERLDRVQRLDREQRGW